MFLVGVFFASLISGLITWFVSANTSPPVATLIGLFCGAVFLFVFTILLKSKKNTRNQTGTQKIKTPQNRLVPNQQEAKETNEKADRKADQKATKVAEEKAGQEAGQEATKVAEKAQKAKEKAEKAKKAEEEAEKAKEEAKKKADQAGERVEKAKKAKEEAEKTQKKAKEEAESKLQAAKLKNKAAQKNKEKAESELQAAKLKNEAARVRNKQKINLVEIAWLVDKIKGQPLREIKTSNLTEDNKKKLEDVKQGIEGETVKKAQERIKEKNIKTGEKIKALPLDKKMDKIIEWYKKGKLEDPKIKKVLDEVLDEKAPTLTAEKKVEIYRENFIDKLDKLLEYENIEVPDFENESDDTLNKLQKNFQSLNTQAIEATEAVRIAETAQQVANALAAEQAAEALAAEQAAEAAKTEAVNAVKAAEQAAEAAKTEAAQATQAAQQATQAAQAQSTQAAQAQSTNQATQSTQAKAVQNTNQAQQTGAARAAGAAGAAGA